MARHFEILSKTRIRRQSPEFNPAKDEGDRILALILAIKGGDLAHCSLDWMQHLEWSLRKAEESYQQGAEEEKLGIVVSPLCSRNEHVNYPKVQSGFIQYVVSPLVEEICTIDSSRELSMEMMTKLFFNKQKWDILKEAGRTEEIPSAIQVPSVSLHNLYFVGTASMFAIFYACLPIQVLEGRDSEHAN
eukprot:Gregarina_sp_Poly_1__4701@NODE_250_length_10686_cov_97_967134_g219_i0_p5_GENE_NODE_250_length_10686_cov_97_967134_g219_i0NODE_250_length_10686_cov_97_967134_g219_i0_p5_ORF_typecomplete_len216_score25_45PDEase_I/PF00233_19/2_6e32_NODE_250_length_10686_cov_97_967134_g219_i082648